MKTQSSVLGMAVVFFLLGALGAAVFLGIQRLRETPIPPEDTQAFEFPAGPVPTREVFRPRVPPQPKPGIMRARLPVYYGNAARPGVSSARQRELDFIRKYDGVLKRYQAYLGKMTRKYWRRYKIVRQVDAEFASLDRYMALKRQYKIDRDPYKWARGAIALPEVRRTIIKYSKKPEVWKVGIKMMTEALRNPPPKPIYDEIKVFMISDKQMKRYVSDFSREIIPQIPANMAQAVPAGTDLSPLLNIAQQIAAEDDSPAGRRNR